MAVPEASVCGALVIEGVYVMESVTFAPLLWAMKVAETGVLASIRGACIVCVSCMGSENPVVLMPKE